jgi:hypothetical protein
MSFREFEQGEVPKTLFDMMNVDNKRCKSFCNFWQSIEQSSHR